MKPPNQIVNPTASKYLDSIQHLINICRNIPDHRWSPQDISYLHEVDSLLDELTVYFEDLDAAEHEPNPDDYEPEN